MDAELAGGAVRVGLGPGPGAASGLGEAEILTYTTREGDFVSSAVLVSRGPERN
jgi:hypothetical protein